MRNRCDIYLSIHRQQRLGAASRRRVQVGCKYEIGFVLCTGRENTFVRLLVEIKARVGFPSPGRDGTYPGDHEKVHARTSGQQSTTCPPPGTHLVPNILPTTDVQHRKPTRRHNLEKRHWRNELAGNERESRERNEHTTKRRASREHKKPEPRKRRD